MGVKGVKAWPAGEKKISMPTKGFTKTPTAAA